MTTDLTSEPAPRRTVRLAWAADVVSIAAIQLEALRGTLPAEVAGDLDVGDLAAAWRLAVSTPPTARHRVLVATEDTGETTGAGGPAVIAAADLGTTGSGRVVGFTATAPAEDPDAEAGVDGEVMALHTAGGDDELTGALLAAAADTLEADGFTRGQIWVGSTEDGLRRVAEGAGWAPDGAHRRLDLPDAASAGIAQVRLHTGLTDDDTGPTGDGAAG